MLTRIHFTFFKKNNSLEDTLLACLKMPLNPNHPSILDRESAHLCQAI